MNRFHQSFKSSPIFLLCTVWKYYSFVYLLYRFVLILPGRSLSNSPTLIIQLFELCWINYGHIYLYLLTYILPTWFLFWCLITDMDNTMKIWLYYCVNSARLTGWYDILMTSIKWVFDNLFFRFLRWMNDFESYIEIVRWKM